MARDTHILRTVLTTAGVAVVDVQLLLGAAVILWIAVTGGQVFLFQGQRVSLLSVDNPLGWLVLLSLLRYFTMRGVPAFGVLHWTPANGEVIARQALLRIVQRIESKADTTPARFLWGALTLATGIKIALAWAHPGFYSGDDVEIHEMSLSTLRHTTWPIWDLRNAVFPLGIIYPVQRVVAAIDASPATLVFSGRAAVAILSSISVWFVWRIGLRQFRDAHGWAACAAIAFAMSKLHVSYGSSELPRPVATVCILAAFWLLQDGRQWRSAAAGMLLGAAASFRFSEAIFLAPALAYLLLRRQWKCALIVSLTAPSTFLGVVGLADLLYWNEPFHSLKASVDYTVIQGASSRGFQSVWWYPFHALEWLNPAVLCLALLGGIVQPRAMDLWAWLPLVILSCLSHKEARYTIPMIPFIYLMACRGLRFAVVRAQQAPSGGRDWRPLGLIALLTVGLVNDIGHWRLRRFDADVQFGRRANEILPPDADVSAEQAWRLGGRVYLPSHLLIDLDPGSLSAPDYLWRQTSARAWIILDRHSLDRHNLRSALAHRNYTKVPLAITGSRYELWAPKQ